MSLAVDSALISLDHMTAFHNNFQLEVASNGISSMAGKGIGPSVHVKLGEFRSNSFWPMRPIHFVMDERRMTNHKQWLHFRLKESNNKYASRIRDTVVKRRRSKEHGVSPPIGGAVWNATSLVTVVYNTCQHLYSESRTKHVKWLRRQKVKHLTHLFQNCKPFRNRLNLY